MKHTMKVRRAGNAEWCCNNVPEAESTLSKALSDLSFIMSILLKASFTADCFCFALVTSKNQTPRPLRGQAHKPGEVLAREPLAEGITAVGTDFSCSLLL